MYMSTCTYNKKSVNNKSFPNLKHFLTFFEPFQIYLFNKKSKLTLPRTLSNPPQPTSNIPVNHLKYQNQNRNFFLHLKKNLDLAMRGCYACPQQGQIQ